MKTRLALPCALVLAAGLAFAQDPPTSTPGAQDRDRSTMSGKTTRLVAEVVSTDDSANTITVRNAKPAEQAGTAGTAGTTPGTAGTTPGTAGSMETVTLPVSGKAIASLKDVSSGDRVSLTCSASAAGPGSTGMSGTTGTTGTTGSTGTTGTTGSTGATAGTRSMGEGKIQASCPAVTAIAKLKASSSPQ
jgi:hypothetical protein